MRGNGLRSRNTFFFLFLQSRCEVSVRAQLVLMLVMFSYAANEYCSCLLPLSAIVCELGYGVSAANLNHSMLLNQLRTKVWNCRAV